MKIVHTGGGRACERGYLVHVATKHTKNPHKRRDQKNLVSYTVQHVVIPSSEHPVHP